MTFIGVKEISNTKKRIASNFYRYHSIVNKSDNFRDYYKKLRVSEFDSRDPDCGWSLKYGKRIYPLKGENIEEIPKNVVGAYIDSVELPNKLFNKKISKRVSIEDIEVDRNDSVKININMYISHYFDGKDIGILVLKEYTKDNNTKIKRYDLNNKGKWQKLSFSFNSKNDGKVPIYFFVFRDNIRSSFKGHIILAYPSFIKIENKNNKQTDWLNTQNQSNILSRAGIFGMESISISEIIDKDTVRNIVTKFISEDTLFYPYKNELCIDTITSKFIGPRINRWKFAVQIFSKEYNWKEKVFGGGFDYLNWYGYYFFHDKTRNDWPHNPFLSVLLYSGIIGLIVYILVLLRAIMLYIKYWKEYFIFFIFFFITFFFAFFSSNSPFTPPVWGFFLIFPYFLHSVHKKTERSKG